MVGDKRSGKIGVGVFGASGYIGSELLRYLAVHPRFDVSWASAHSHAGHAIEEVLPNLLHFAAGRFCTMEEGRARMDEVGAVFLALPHHDSQRLIPALARTYPDVVFVDLAGDFRSADVEGYRRHYGRDHVAGDLLGEFVYGLPEFRRRDILGARLVANPGCFATAILLTLAPLARKGLLSGDICVTGITGSSGSGASPKPTTHHPERAANIRSYRPLEHQHLLEVEEFLRSETDRDMRLLFVAQSAPIVRGIYVTAFLPGVSPARLTETYRDAYQEEAFVNVVEGSPDLRWVQGTPQAFVGFAGAEPLGSVGFGVIDNLGKGAAGQAIQNLNCVFGFDETDGLRLPGGFI